jgi:hypothetical protein
MTMSLRMLCTVLVVAAVSASTHAQQPVRDGTPTAKRIGTGTVAGVVTLGDDARTPVRRAVVTLTAADGTEKLGAISGDDGRFTIGRVPAGQYTLEADKPAYLTLAYGARRPGRRGTMLIVTDGQRVADLPLSLPRGAVLAGRVALPDGQPVSNVQMMAIPSWLTTGGGTPPAGTREFRTNDLGEFRLFGLPPDTYVVAALPSFGRGEVERMSDAAISSVLRQLQQPGSPAGAPAGSPVTVTYAPVYFPGTPSIGEARSITVAAGDVREDLSFTITAFPAAIIRGHVVGLDGAPTQAVTLTLEGIGPALPAGATGVGRINQPDRNGEFEVRGVSPGMYRLRARAGGVKLDANGKMLSARGDAQTQFAMAEVSVAGADIDGVVLALQEGHRFAGTLTADGSAAPPALTGASISVEPMTNGIQSVLAGTAMPGVAGRDATVDQAGRFAVMGLEPFNYEIQVTLPPAVVAAGWHVESIRYGDRDLRDAPFTFAGGSLEDVKIRLTTTVTELTGRLTTSGDGHAPETDYFIVAFPADRGLWYPASPRVQVLRPAVDGTFSTKNLPAGTYRLAVLTDVDAHDPQQRAFLESVYDASIEVSLSAGQTTRQDMRVGRRPN